MQLSRRRNSVGKDALLLTASNFMVSIIGVITSMLLARFRTLGEYGTYSQIIMVTDLVSTILLLGLPGSVNYFVAKADREEDKQKFLTLYLVMSTAITAVIGVCLFLAMPLIISYFDNPYISSFAYIFAVYPWASIIINSLSNVCVVYGKSDRLVIFNVVHVVVNLIVLLLAQWLELGFETYTVIYIIAMLCFALFAVWWMRRISGGFRFSFDPKLIKTIFAFSIPLGLASSVGSLNAELDKLIIGKFFSTEEYAIFANASKQLPVTILATSLTAVLMPKMVRLLKENKNSEAVSLWGSSINISFCLMCLIVGGFVVFAPDVMSLFYSEKYVTDGGVAVFRIYSLILLLRCTYWGLVLNATGRTKFIFYSSLLTLAFNCVGNIACYYIFGFIGPAIASLAVLTLMSLAQVVISARYLGVSFKRILPWKTMGIFMLETALLGGVFYAVKSMLGAGQSRITSIIVSVCLGAVWAAIYLLMNYRKLKADWVELNKEKVEE